MSKAPIAVAIIAKNSGKTIAACLDSLVPYVQQVVVCVDDATTDDTARVARKHGAKVFTGLQVSEWHECPEHGRIKAQHFARARQVSFSKLDPAIPWQMWVDADDVVKNGARLAEMIAKLPPETEGVWLPYHYSQAVKDGPTSTLFDRERIVRAGAGWQWLHRVHEVLAPINRPTEAVNWTRTADIAIYHQGEGHDTAGSARRNITLLEIDLEENPEDMRALFYLGNQYFALSEWAVAAHWYERATAAHNPYQVWQTWLYLSMAYEKLGDLNGAKDAAYHAMDVAPYHPEPYLRLAAVDGLLINDLQRCEFWTKLSEGMADPPSFAFRNPLDRTFNAAVTLGNAYANNGHVSKARQQFERAAAVVPSQPIVEGIRNMRQMETESQLADSYVNLLNAGVITASTLPTLNGLWKFGRIRDVVVPTMLKNRLNTQPRAVFFCGRSIEPWAPPSLNTTGIGGSETAVVKIAERFARDGWRVDVYNDSDKYEGEYEGVGYWDGKRFGSQGAETADLFVSWRRPDLPPEMRIGRLNVLWCHDLNKGPDEAGLHRSWDLVLGVSQWHADYLRQVYGLERVDYVPNGIELERFVPVPLMTNDGHPHYKPIPAGLGFKKVPFRCVYASSPDRGLERLLELWPRIVENEPTAELHIAYGWQSIDKYIQMGHQQLAAFKAHILDLISRTPKVIWRDRMAQDELAKLYSESYALLYPSDFLEVSCIVTMESMAAGCVPVVSGVGALPETVAKGGLVVPGNVYTRVWRDYYVNIAKGVLHSPEVRQSYQRAGRKRVKDLTWDKAYERWKEVTTKLLEGGKVLEAIG